MIRLSRKALPGLFVILALVLGAWTVAPQGSNPPGGGSGSGSGSQTMPKSASDFLAKIPGATQEMQRISSFKMNSKGISAKSVAKQDTEFLQDAFVSNKLELFTMQETVNKVQDQNLKSLIQMMIVMHTQDQKTIDSTMAQLSEKSNESYKSASVYPNTPDYNLGYRVENLQEEYLSKINSAPKAKFDEVVLSVLLDEHTPDVQSEITAEYSVKDASLSAFAKHSAEVTEFHIKLLSHVEDQDFLQVKDSLSFPANNAGK